MKIRKLTASFGKLENESLSFHEGLNIIYAPNESGKSTWCAFIRAMLYGIDTGERAKAGFLPDKLRYAPWSGALMEGSMELTADRCDITITRTTRAKSAPMREFSATYTGTNTPVDGMTGQNAGELLTGVTKDVFRRSAFIEQGTVAVSGSPELEKRISAIVTTGEEQTSYTEADERLRAWQRKRRYNRRGMLPELEGRWTKPRAGSTTWAPPWRTCSAWRSSWSRPAGLCEGWSSRSPRAASASARTRWRASTRAARRCSARATRTTRPSRSWQAVARPCARPALGIAHARSWKNRCRPIWRALSAQIAKLNGRLSAMGDPLVLASSLSCLRRSTSRSRASTTPSPAEDTLREADAEIQSRFSPKLGRLAAQYMSEVTGGRYEDVLINRDFSARARTKDDAVARDAEYLSAGTLDLMYLAVRLAVCELALPDGEPCPLILDDALVNLDEERFDQAMELLKQIARERQVILFTCREGKSAIVNNE